MSDPTSNYYILRKVNGTPQYLILPMYLYAGGATERISFTVCMRYTMTLQLFSDTDPGDTIDYITTHTIMPGYVDNANQYQLAPAATTEGELGYVEYEYPELTISHGIAYPAGTLGEEIAKDNGKRWQYNGEQSYQILKKIRLYDPKTDMATWTFIITGQQDYYRHLFETDRNVGDPI